MTLVYVCFWCEIGMICCKYTINFLFVPHYFSYSINVNNIYLQGACIQMERGAMHQGASTNSKPTQSVYYSVIDTWATMLNDTEKYKSDKSPLRLFCTIEDLVIYTLS